MTVPALELRGVSRRYRLPRRSLWRPGPTLVAVEEATLTLGSGETLGVIGESGSGKSTLARLAMALERPDAGQVLIAGRDPWSLSTSELRRARAGFQMVFQDPMGSLDPRRSAGWSVAEPLIALELDRAERRARAEAALEAVGLAGAADRYPHEFSGGQRQRIAVARALAAEPRLIVADEPVSALDVSVQAQVLNLLMEVQERTGAALLFISHDLTVVSALCDRTLVMGGGRVLAQGPTATILANPPHPYEAWSELWTEELADFSTRTAKSA